MCIVEGATFDVRGVSCSVLGVSRKTSPVTLDTGAALVLANTTWVLRGGTTARVGMLQFSSAVTLRGGSTLVLQGNAWTLDAGQSNEYGWDNSADAKSELQRRVSACFNLLQL